MILVIPQDHVCICVLGVLRPTATLVKPSQAPATIRLPDGQNAAIDTESPMLAPSVFEAPVIH